MDEERRNLIVLSSAIVYVLILAAGFGGLLAATGGRGCIPNVDFQYVAAGLTVTYTSTSTCIATGATFQWNFGDGSSGTSWNVTHVYAAAGTYQVTLAVQINYGSATKAVTVTAPGSALAASFTYTFTPATSLYWFSPVVSGGQPPYAYTWALGDGTTSTNPTPSHVYAPGTYTVLLSVKDGAGTTATSSKLLNVAGSTPLNPTFNWKATGLSVSFQAVCTNCPSGTTYAWAFGDAQFGSGSAITHAYPGAGSYVAVLTATDPTGRSASATNQIGVQQSVSVSISYFAVFLNVTFLGTPSGGTSSYVYWSWSFGDGGFSAGQSPSHAYAAAGTYTVSVSVSDSAGNAGSSSRSVTVVAAPTPGPLTVTMGAVAQNLTALFTASVTGGTLPYTYFWTFGDNGISSLQAPAHTYAKAGNYSVNVFVTDGQGTKKSAAQTVTVSAAGGCPSGYSGTYPNCVPPVSLGLPILAYLNVISLAIGLLALAIAIVLGIGTLDTLEEREKWGYGLAVFAVGAFLLIEAGLASPWILKPF